MTERSISFKAPMVRAILSGSKTVTRRFLCSDSDDFPPPYLAPLPSGARACWENVHTGRVHGFPGAAGAAVGDLLWVREAWRSAAPLDDFSPSAIGEESMEIAPVRYEADGESVNWTEWRGHDAGRLRAGMHMPRWASRITLEVVGVKVERLQSISEEEAKAEGVYFKEPTAEDHEWAKAYALETGEAIDVEGVWIAPGTRQGFGPRPNDPQWGPTASFAFRLLWDSINGEREGASWASNPWIAAISFRVVKP